MSVVDKLAPGATGLEQMRALMNAARAPMGETLGFRLVEVEEGRAVFESTPGPHLYNPIGMVHGGYAATLLDSACGSAVHSKCSATQGHTTIELKVAYHRPITDKTGPLRAEGKVLNMGRRVAFSEATLKDAAGKLYASATSTLLVFNR